MRSSPPEIRLAARQARAKPIIEELKRWLEQTLQTLSTKSDVAGAIRYPTDLKIGGGEVSRLVREYDVRLIDMGHTHYNEIANDGLTLYSATRSTGQIEEGPVGYSVTNIDGNVVSWRFVELGKLPHCRHHFAER